MEELRNALSNLYNRFEQTKDNISTEEATKNALVMPFLSTLGYDVFNPMEIVPEFTADIGDRRGEKVDYAIIKDGVPVVLIECKHWRENCNIHNNQLLRYFNVTETAKFAILTNGIVYNFYTDKPDQPNIMDETPFLSFDLENIRESTLKELLKFKKQEFDIEQIISTAEELRFVSSIKYEFEKELKDPSEELIRLLFRRFYNGQITKNRLVNFKEYTNRAISSSINELINSRLRNALNISQTTEVNTNINNQSESEEPQINNNDNSNDIITTDEELQAYYIIKAILSEIIPTDRIAMRDTQTYCGILLDDNNRKPICRLYFNSVNRLSVMFFENRENPERVYIDAVDLIYQYRDKLINTVRNYDEQ